MAISNLTNASKTRNARNVVSNAPLRRRVDVIQEELADAITETKTTSELVKLGFTVIIATTAATVVTAIAMLITTMISLYVLWTDQSEAQRSPVNSCTILGAYRQNY